MLTWKSLQQHRKTLPRHVQISSQLHQGNHLRDNRVVIARHSSAEGNDANHARRVSFQVLDVLLWLFQEIQSNDFALVILNFSVPPNGLDANAQVHQLAVNPPVVAVGVGQDAHSNEVVLPRAELAEDDHPWSGGVDLGLFFEDFVGGPGVVDPDSWVSAIALGATSSGDERERGMRQKLTGLSKR